MSAAESLDLQVDAATPLAHALQGAALCLWSWDLRRDALSLSSPWRRLLGEETLALQSTPDAWLERVHPLDQQRLHEAIAEHIDGITPALHCEHRLRTRGGRYTWVLAHGQIVRDERGEIAHLAGSLLDLSAPPLHDNLTALPSRSLMVQRLERALAAGNACAVICLGVDQIKPVNEIYGQAAGDALLREMAERLGACLREERGFRLPATMEYTLASLGGGEFAVLCRHAERRETVDAVAAQLQERLSGLVLIDPWRLRVTTSAGIRLAEKAEVPAEDLVRDSQVAMRRAREARVERRMAFDEEMRRATYQQMSLEAEISDGLQRDEFFLEYQPVIDMRSGAMIGVEALVRWRSPARGVVSPGVFMPVAEETGLILQLGELVLRTGCERCAAWRRESGLDLHIAINISPHQLRQEDFTDLVARALEESGLPPAALYLEITESACVGDETVVAPLLHRLKGMGLTILLDDFGTGYSALSYLLKLPFDILKLDSAFVTGIEVSSQAASLTRTILAMAHSLGLAVVAEGIETPEQARFLEALGCEYVQGYLYSRPLPEAALLRWALGRKAAA